MISSTPFKVKLGLRDQGVGQVWKTNWSWQFQWTTSSCCSCMVLGYWMFTCFRSNFVWWSPHHCRCTYTKCWPLDTDLPLLAGHWYLNQRRPKWHFIIPQQRSGDGMDWWIFQETFCVKRLCYLRSTGFSNTIMTTMGSVSNGLLLELNNFRNRNGYSVKVLLSWLQSLCDSFNNMTPAQLNKLVKKTSNDMKSLQKHKGYIGGFERQQEFQELSCQPSPTTNSATGVTCCQPQELQSSSVSEPCGNGTGHTSSPQESIPVSDAESQMLTASVAQQFDIARSQIDAVRELLSDEKATVHLLQDVQKLQKVNETLKSKLHASRTCEAATKAKLWQISEQCTKFRHRNINRRFVRLKNKHEQVVAKLHSVQPLAAELQNEKQKKRHYQKCVSKLEQKHKQMKEELEEVTTSLLDESLELQPVVPETRTERGYFRNFVVTCIYELVGECEVPASRCHEVIKTVSKHFFGVTFEDHQLLGRTTNLRFADQSHSLAKMQVAESVSTQHFDLHADGTTKKQKKYVGLQVTLENKHCPWVSMLLPMKQQGLFWTSPWTEFKNFLF